MENRYQQLKAGQYSDIAEYESRVIEIIKEHVGSAGVLLGLSGGVDSSVCAALLAKAIPGKLHCIFVDHGLMRKNEGDQVEAAFKNFDLNLIRINAEDRFLQKLKGVTEPEKKRKIIGEEFIRVFEEEAKKLSNVEFLAQGTIYPDVTESGQGDNALIKSHHNVGGLPENIDFKGIVEPLWGLYKEQVREIGRRLGLPPVLTNRQPFPGPGLAVRCIGELSRERLDILREADAIFREEVEKANLDINQYFAILTNMRSVGIKDGMRVYGSIVALRAVTTSDFVTAGYACLPYEVLDKVSARITTEVPDVCRVVYDVTGKPPGTVEWE